MASWSPSKRYSKPFLIKDKLGFFSNSLVISASLRHNKGVRIINHDTGNMETRHTKNRVKDRKTWLISDTHFGHAKILGYEGRPWDDIDEHDEALIARWNSVVEEGDTVWHLGDVALKSPSKEYKALVHRIIPRLNGRKRLVMGNHDRGRSATWWINVGFREAIKYPRAIVVDGIVLSHVPMPDLGMPNIHGHLHSGDSNHRGGLWNPATHQCVSVEQIDFQPVRWEDIVARF